MSAHFARMGGKWGARVRGCWKERGTEHFCLFPPSYIGSLLLWDFHDFHRLITNGKKEGINLITRWCLFLRNHTNVYLVMQLHTRDSIIIHEWSNNCSVETRVLDLGFNLGLLFSALWKTFQKTAWKVYPSFMCWKDSVLQYCSMPWPWYMKNRFLTLVIHKHHVLRLSLI